MNELVLLFTQFGQIVGEVVETSMDGDITLRNPVQIHRLQNQVMFVPMLEFTNENELIISKSDWLFDTTFEPNAQVEQAYRQQFSSLDLIAAHKPELIV